LILAFCALGRSSERLTAQSRHRAVDRYRERNGATF
jgi:hypothetical protein